MSSSGILSVAGLIEGVVALCDLENVALGSAVLFKYKVSVQDLLCF